MKNIIIILLVILGAAGGGYAVGRYFTPPRVKEVVKTVEVKDVYTVVREVQKPDGTKERVTEIVDKSKMKTDIQKVTEAKPNWRLRGGATVNPLPVYSLGVEHRLIGPVFGGIQWRTNHEIEVNLSVEF